MSAFVVGNDTISRVVTYLNKNGTRTLLLLGFTIDDDAACERLGAALRELNEEAVRQRYGDGDLPGERSPYEWRVTPGSDVQALKSLRCLLYQCSEGDVPERALFAALEEVSGRWALDIVSGSAAYQALPWD